MEIMGFFNTMKEEIQKKLFMEKSDAPKKKVYTLNGKTIIEFEPKIVKNVYTVQDGLLTEIIVIKRILEKD